METVFRNMENRKTRKPHKFVLVLPQRLDIKGSNKHVNLQNLSIYYTWKKCKEIVQE